jgi:phosphatidylglycerol:prolipoprotein diacylglycerol transferase
VTIGIDPTPTLRPVTLAWHGLMTKVGLAAGAAFALRFARREALSRDALTSVILVAALSGIVGARLWYLVEQDAGALLRPWEWLETRGLAFWGAIVAGTLGAAIAMRRRRLGAAYFDALAAGTNRSRDAEVRGTECGGRSASLPWRP